MKTLCKAALLCGALLGPVPAFPQEQSLFDGLVTLTVPEGWTRLEQEGTVMILPPVFEVLVTIASGPAGDALLAAVPEGAETAPADLAGMPATRLDWTGAGEEFVSGRGFVRGVYTLWRVEGCATGAGPLSVQLAGGIEAVTRPEVAALIAGMVVQGPGAAGCEAAPAQDAPAKVAVAETDPAPAPGKAPGLVPVPQPPAPPMDEPDSFTEDANGWTLYQNARYGTFISFPGTYYTPDPPPGNGDGRRFVSVDGTSEFMVFAQMNVFGLDAQGLLEQDRDALALDRVLAEEATPGLYTLDGLRGDFLIHRRAIVEGPDGLIEVFEISYPVDRAEDFGPMVDYMAQSFGPGFSADAGWGEAMPMPDPAAIYSPARNTAERQALADAARGPIEAALGAPVIFQISVLRTDGVWAYLQAEPLAPGGGPFDWSQTPFAEDIAQDRMSTVLMVLMMQDGTGWQVADYIIGPTDVAWYGWVTDWGLPEALFTP